MILGMHLYEGKMRTESTESVDMRSAKPNAGACLDVGQHGSPSVSKAPLALSAA
jgi:hypothetical protein